MVPASDVPFTCQTSAEHTVNVTADFTNTHISATIDLPGRIFSFSAIVEPVFSLGVKFKGTAECKLADGFGLNIPIPSVPGLLFTIGPYLSLSASGTIDVSGSWDPAFFVNIARAPGDDQQFIQYKASTSAGGSGSAMVELKGGLTVMVSEAKQAGLEIDAGPILTATASVGTDSDCISVSSEIELEAKLFAHAFGFVDAELVLYDGHFFHSTLVSKCTPGTSGSSGGGSASPPQSGGSGGSPGSGPYLGPTVSETTGGVARTWTDYVHAGGTRGPDIAPNRAVGIVCRTNGFKVPDGNTWWYLIGSSPWNASFYVSADPFYNNGQTSGELRGTPFVDTSVPECASQVGGNPVPVTPPTSPPGGSGKTYAETTGGLTRTFTDYSDAGGTQGPSIASNATVQVPARSPGSRWLTGTPGGTRSHPALGATPSTLRPTRSTTTARPRAASTGPRSSTPAFPTAPARHRRHRPPLSRRLPAA